jgi:hypothetical protein
MRSCRHPIQQPLGDEMPGNVVMVRAPDTPAQGDGDAAGAERLGGGLSPRVPSSVEPSGMPAFPAIDPSPAVTLFEVDWLEVAAAGAPLDPPAQSSVDVAPPARPPPSKIGFCVALALKPDVVLALEPVKSGHAGATAELRPLGVSSVAPSGMLLWKDGLEGTAVPSAEADPVSGAVACAKTAARPTSSITTAAVINIPEPRMGTHFFFIVDLLSIYLTAPKCCENAKVHVRYADSSFL